MLILLPLLITGLSAPADPFPAPLPESSLASATGTPVPGETASMPEPANGRLSMLGDQLDIWWSEDGFDRIVEAVRGPVPVDTMPLILLRR